MLCTLKKICFKICHVLNFYESVMNEICGYKNMLHLLLTGFKQRIIWMKCRNAIIPLLVE